MWIEEKHGTCCPNWKFRGFQVKTSLLWHLQFFVSVSFICCWCFCNYLYKFMKIMASVFLSRFFNWKQKFFQQLRFFHISKCSFVLINFVFFFSKLILNNEDICCSPFDSEFLVVEIMQLRIYIKYCKTVTQIFTIYLGNIWKNMC